MSQSRGSPTFKANPNPGKLNTSMWESGGMFKKEEKKARKIPKKVSLYGKSFTADKEAEEQPEERPKEVVIGGDDDNKDAEPEDKTGMVQIRGKCASLGCKCAKYVVPTSKWAKGKCKSCDHAPEKHKQEWVKESQVEEEADKPAAPTTPNTGSKPKTPTPAQAEPVAEPEPEPEPEALENLWGEEFTDKLKECVSNTFEYDEQSILQGKYLLYYLKKRIEFDFTGQSKHGAALKFVLVDLFEWKVMNRYGYNVRLK